MWFFPKRPFSTLQVIFPNVTKRQKHKNFPSSKPRLKKISGHMIDLLHSLFPTKKQPPRTSTLIDKSWKTHPVFFWNLSFPGCDQDGFLENSSRIFSKFQFPRHELDFWKIYPSLSCEYLFSFFRIWGSELDRFLGNSSIFAKMMDEFSIDRSSSCREFEQNWIIGTHRYS